MKSPTEYQMRNRSTLLCLFALIFAATSAYGRVYVTSPNSSKLENDSIWKSAPVYTDLARALAAKSAGETVLRLNLSRKKLRTIPPELGDLTDLKELTLDRTKINGLPMALEKLQHLEYFSANGNKMTDFPEVILSWYDLEYLSLGNNLIDSIPLNIDRLGKLRTLNLWSNLIAFFPASLGDLTQLHSLDLTTNDMTEEEQSQLKTWINASTKLLLSAPCRCDFDNDGIRKD